MKLRFVLGGSLIATAESDNAPQIGAEVLIRKQSYNNGVTVGSLLSFSVSSEFPPIYDYSTDPVEVSIDVNGYQVLEKGPSVD